MSRISFVIILCILSLNSFGQEILVRGQFQTDSIKIGEVFPYSLTARYPSTTNIVFPDSTYTFTPFEIDHKTYFATQTQNGISFDSAVYYLTSFEIDSIQRLSLPVFIVHQMDCTVLQAREDTVFLQHLVAHVPDTVAAQKLPLKTNTAYHAVSWLMNYPLLLISGGVLAVVVILVWIIFGKRIRKYFKVRSLNRKHHQFLADFESAVSKFETDHSSQRAESALAIWKKYMEQLLASPFTKYTSREIFQMIRDESLGQSLRKIDRVIYSGSVVAANGSFSQLKNFTEERFQQKIAEVKNG